MDLGCGEGMFSNSLSLLLPNAQIYGVDLDAKKIRKAQACKLRNVVFTEGDAHKFEFERADAVIFNDMLHHNPYKEQEVLISHSANLLKDDGLLILKEVNSWDKSDAFLTTFFDKRLYPDDKLNFRHIESWSAVLETQNFEVLAVEVVRHPWIASRTVFVARKSPKSTCYFEENKSTPSLGYKSENLKVFLTGASGFIGHHMATHLINNGLDGRGVDLVLLARSPIRIDRTLREKATIIKSDLLSLCKISHWRIFEHVDYVFHFAAEVKMKGDPEDLIRNNIEGTRFLIEVFEGKNLKRFIHASTMGAVDRRPDDPCTNPMNEKTPPYPLTVYGKTKLEAERVVQSSGLPYSILRIPWAFGSRMTSDTHIRNLLERITRRSLSTRINFPGKVSIIAVEDLVRAFELGATNPKALNDIFFVAGYPPIRLGELFKKMASVSIGAPTKLLPVPSLVKFLFRKIRRILPLAIQNLNSDVLCVDYTKIKNLGFQPKCNIVDNLIHLSAWIHQQHSPKKKNFIITGASSGIGLELSKKLVASGRDVLLVDKNEGKLTEIARMLGMPYLCMDLTSTEDMGCLLDSVKNGIEFHGLINCAGIGRKDAIVDLLSEKIDEIIAVNISAVVKLSKEALKIFRKQGYGILVNISSTAALQPLPFFSVYAASKTFVLNFSESVCYEYRKDMDIRILGIIPSGTDTEFQASAGVNKNPKEKLLSPKYVADRITVLIEKNHPSGTYFVGNRGKIMSFMARVLPKRLNTKIWGNLVLKTR